MLRLLSRGGRILGLWGAMAGTFQPLLTPPSRLDVVALEAGELFTRSAIVSLVVSASSPPAPIPASVAPPALTPVLAGSGLA